MTTPSLEAHINDLIDQRLRQMQTAYPAKVIAYDSATAIATIQPLFIETWRGPNDERITETIDEDEDAYVENVLVMHPRAGVFRVALPVAPGDTGLAVVTKFSLDRFREGAGMSDPGDLRKFTMSGTIFFPVNLFVDADPIDCSDDDTVITLSAGGAVDFLCLYTETKKNFDDISTMLTDVKTVMNSHVHVETGTSTEKLTTPMTAGYGVTDPINTTVKVQ